jgi:hypothetical protein
MVCRAGRGVLSIHERELTRTVIYLWRHQRHSNLLKLMELNNVGVYLWDSEEELAGLPLGMS